MEHKTITQEDFEYCFVYKHGELVCQLPPPESPPPRPTFPLMIFLSLLSFSLKKSLGIG